MTLRFRFATADYKKAALISTMTLVWISLLEAGDNRNFRLQGRLAFSRTGHATPSFLLQFLDLFRSFRFGPVLVEFFSGFAAERLEI